MVLDPSGACLFVAARTKRHDRALGNVFGFSASLIPLGLGLVSAVWGLNTAMWLLLAGPIVLLFGLSQGGMRGSKK